jgi:hypothetical protein
VILKVQFCANFDVEALCKKFPERLQQAVEAEGDRISP